MDGLVDYEILFLFSCINTLLKSFSLLPHLTYQTLPKAIEHAGDLRGYAHCAINVDTILGAFGVLMI